MNEKPVRDFVAAINSHNVESIASLMTDNHSFVDAQNNSVHGKEKLLNGWKGYFEWFPDYKIEIEKIIAENDTFAVFGFAEGTFHQLKGDSSKAHWRLPASWKAVVKDNKIALWQVYADTKIPFEIIERYSVTQEENKILGLGGAFFKSKDPKKLCAWYDEHLGTSFGANQYQLFTWRERTNKQQIGSTTFGVFKETSTYFDPSKNPFMFNFRVKNLEQFLSRLKKEGVHVMEKTESYDYGKFGWIVDLEGNKIELWEPMNEQIFDK